MTMGANRSRVPTALAGVLLWTSAAVVGQSDPNAFAAVSVRPVVSGSPATYVGAPNRFHNPDATLVSLVAFAYDVQEFQVTGGAGWVRRDRFDVNGVAEGEPSQAQMRRLVQRLLADRFGLSVREQVREMPVYALETAATASPTLRRADKTCAAGSSTVREAERPSCRSYISVSDTTARLVMDGVTLKELGRILERFVDRAIVDETGLDGPFDVELQFAADQITWRLPIPPTPLGTTSDGLSLSSALREQLGLRLLPRRGMVRMIDVSDVHLPTAN